MRFTMIRAGMLGDASRLLPICEGFDKKPEIDMSRYGWLTEADEDAIDNVVVPTLPDDKYVRSNKKKEDSVTTDTIGAAGNSLVAEEPEPQMGAIGGMGGGLKLTEADESMVIDDSAMKTAQQSKEKNSIERAKEFFEDFDMFRPKVNPTFNLDTTKIKPVTSDKPIRSIPRGW